MTKTQRRAKAKAGAAKRRKITAGVKMLKAMNPGRKIEGLKIRRNPRGSITIIPVKLPRRATR